LPGQHLLALDGKNWEPDELIMDERFLAGRLALQGEVLVCDQSQS